MAAELAGLLRELAANDSWNILGFLNSGGFNHGVDPRSYRRSRGAEQNPLLIDLYIGGSIHRSCDLQGIEESLLKVDRALLIKEHPLPDGYRPRGSPDPT